jgi:hypothetical protein
MGCDALLLRAWFPTFRSIVTPYSCRTRNYSRVKKKTPLRYFETPRTTFLLTLLSHFTRNLSSVVLRQRTKLNTSACNRPPPVPPLYKAVCWMKKKKRLSLADRDWGQDFNHMRKYDNGMPLEHYYYCRYFNSITMPYLGLHSLVVNLYTICGWQSKFLRSPDTAYLCVLCGSQNKQRLFPYTALTDWFM